MRDVRTALIVSPYFPPSSLAGVHRARHLAKHLPAFDWRPVVVCVDERHHEERLDPTLAARLPSGLKLLKSSALPSRLTRLVGVGDVSLRAFGALRTTVRRAIINERPEVVLITGSPFYPMLMAGWIRRRFGIPVVLDFQDPWVSGAVRRPLTKPWLADRLARALEPGVIRAASFVTSVSEIQNEQLAVRYPWYDQGRMAAIPIGGDPEDFLVSDRSRSPIGGQGLFRLVYVGAFWPKVEGPLRLFLRALGRLRAERPDLASRLRVEFVGTDPRLRAMAIDRVAPIAAEEGVGDLVRESSARIPFGEALATMANADGLLLIGSDEPHYTASKIYPALMTGRPFVSLFHASSSAHEVLRRAGGGVAIPLEDSEGGTERSLVQALKVLLTDPASLGAVDPSAYAAFTAREIAGQFASVLERAADR